MHTEQTQIIEEADSLKIFFSTFISFAVALNAEANPSVTKIERKVGRLEVCLWYFVSPSAGERDKNLSAHSKLIQVS